MEKQIIEKEYVMPEKRVDLKKKKRQKKYQNFWYKITVFTFIIVIFGMLILRIALPVPTVSMAENRELKKMPPASLNNIFFGKFTAEFEDYFADTFPMRDPLMNAGEYVSYLYKIPISGVDSIVMADDNIMQEEDSPDVDSADPIAIDIIKGDQRSEAVPSPTETIVINPLTGETQTPTPEPQEQKGKYLLNDTAIYKEIKLNSESYKNWAQGICRLARELPGKRVMAMSPPTSFLFYADPKYLKPENNQRACMADLYGQFDKDVISIDPTPFLDQHKSEYIYFRTDHHWTARGAYYGYLAFCEKTGITPVPLDEFQQNIFSTDFLGSYYQKVKNSAKAKIIKESPDYIEFFIPPAECTVMKYNNTSLEDGRKGSLFDTNPEDKSSQYCLFLGGDNPCIKITTDTNNGKSILIFKDSYANSFASFLAAHYQTIYLVDYRRYNTSKLPQLKIADFMKKNGVDDVLFLLHFAYINSPKDVKWYLKALT